MRIKYLISAFWILTTLLGCVSTQDSFKQHINAYLDRKFSDTFFSVMEYKITRINRSETEYRITGLAPDCEIALTVNESTNIIKGWTYISSASNCIIQFTSHK